MSWSSEVLADSPLAWYRLGDTSGTTMTDSSGNSHNGTYTGTYSLNAASLITSDSDPSVDFTSAKGTVTGASWMNSSSFSVEAVIRADTISASYNFIVSRDLNGTVGPWWLSLKNGKVSFYLFAGSGTEFVGTTTLSANTTYHLVCTYDGANMRIYINGTQDASTAKTGTPTANTQDLVIGNWNASSLPFDGRIDEVALYGTALSSTRVAAHYTAATTNPNATVNAVAATATATAVAPTRSAGSTVNGVAAAASAAALAPTVSGTGDGTVAAVAATATAAALPPGVVADASVTGAPSTATASALSPSLSFTANVAATAAAATADAIVPFVDDGSGSQNVNPPPATATATALAPAVNIVLTSGTQVSNSFAGLDLIGVGDVAVEPPVVDPPVPSVGATRVTKAVALPEPVLVKGRPT